MINVMHKNLRIGFSIVYTINRLSMLKTGSFENLNDIQLTEATHNYIFMQFTHSSQLVIKLSIF